MVDASAGAAGVAEAAPGVVCVWQPAMASIDESDTTMQRRAEADDCRIGVRVYVIRGRRASVPACSRLRLELHVDAGSGPRLGVLIRVEDPIKADHDRVAVATNREPVQIARGVTDV